MTSFDPLPTATLLYDHFRAGTRFDQLSEAIRPRSRAEGYAVQAQLARLYAKAVVGWKIAATSAAGQQHIGVDGPLAGRLFADRVFTANSAEANAIDLRGQRLCVAEAEFAFRMAIDLPARASQAPYSVNEVMAAVDTLHLAVEVPDTRINKFETAGAPALIADLACAAWWIVGEPIAQPWRDTDLAAHSVTAKSNGSVVASGVGGNALGDPRLALTWLANELVTYGDGLRAGDYVTTGTCTKPLPVAPGDHIEMDFGVFGSLAIKFA